MLYTESNETPVQPPGGFLMVLFTSPLPTACRNQRSCNGNQQFERRPAGSERSRSGGAHATEGSLLSIRLVALGTKKRASCGKKISGCYLYRELYPCRHRADEWAPRVAKPFCACGVNVATGLLENSSLVIVS